ncbi:hypothetical protein F4820DRAFT_205460 [Hypoxylon rubiginosum]|uniref:Uncharacterized protein n=1 Tax=Hypoxylon rubiginosum TaxID=110542 RepID=A0ACB9YH22_9PEZI|nr:hypothetical protein F4820DRAFT_205460 [Hypoxylon rubiginosum]
MYTKALFLAALTASACAQVPMPALLPRKTTAADPETTSTSPECLSRIESWSGAIPTPAPSLQDALNDNADGGMAESGVAGLCDFGVQLPKALASAFTSYNLDMYSYLSAQSSNLVALATSCSGDMGAPPGVITSQLDELLIVYSSFSAGACKVEATTTADGATTTATGTGSGAKSTATITSSGSATVKVGAATVTSTVASSDAVSSSISTTTTVDNPGASASDAANSAASSILSSATPTQNAGARETGMRAVAALAVGLVGAAVAL